MQFGIHPIVLAAVLGSAIGFLILAGAFFTRRRTLKVFLVAMASIALTPCALFVILVNPWILDARFRTYKSFYNDIEVGMTRVQVLSLMNQHYPTNGTRLPPRIVTDTSDKLGFFMNPEGSREPNCEGIFLTLDQGIVETLQYSPD